MLERCWEHRDAGGSLRSFASDTGMPPSTLTYMVRRAEAPDGGELWRRFVETPSGLERLHRIVLAALYVIVLRSGGGIRMVQEFLRYAGLDDVVASGYGTLQRRQRALEDAIVAFGSQQTRELGERMPEKELTLAQDETFHGGRPCLVAMDVISNYLLVEQFADDRTAGTWTKLVDAATASMPVMISQCVTDGARALRSHVEHDLGAHASPDLFHVQQDVRRATSRALRKRAEQAAEQLGAATEAVEQAERSAEAYLAAPRGPGRPVDHDKRIDAANAAQKRAQTMAEQARWDQHAAHDAAAALTAAYHLFDPVTGAPVESEALQEALQEAFAVLETTGERASLPERGRTLLGKAHRLVASMVTTLTVVWSLIRLDLDVLDIEPEMRRRVERELVAACYLERVAVRAPSAGARKRVLERAEALRASFEQNHPAWQDLEPEHRAHIERTATKAADRFQRSSSCVEGRNGVLALGRHSFHELLPRRLAALTTVHNFAIRRHDGTTAAERFFELQHPDLFEHLLLTLPPPARPRQRRAPAQPRTVPA